jgi:hypothetical protein
MPNIMVTANGKAVDMETLRLKNEKTVAVGNMRVNARGDELSPTTGEIVKTREQRMSEHYRLHTTVPSKRQRSPKTTAETAIVDTSVEPTSNVSEDQDDNN